MISVRNQKKPQKKMYRKHPISIEQFHLAHRRLSPWVKETAFKPSVALSERTGVEVYLKMENEQKTGSFKVRGALNKILSLSEKERTKGVISSSAGNHAQGTAFAARCVHTSALLVLPENAPVVKREAVRRYGSKMILHGKIYDESYSYALQLAKKEHKTFIHAYKDPLVIKGQGGVGLEMLKQVPDLDSVIVPIGGGGLIGGIACVVKQIRPECKVYGVVSTVAPAMEHLFHKKPAPSVVSEGRLADGIIVKKPNPFVFKNYISRYVDDIVSVTEEETASAIVLLLEREKTLAEGAGAVTTAALLKQKNKWNLGKKCGVVISGGNIDLNIISDVVEQGLQKASRSERLSLIKQARPGAKIY